MTIKPPVLTLRLTPELQDAIGAAAQRAGISVSAWVRRAVERDLNWADASTPPLPHRRMRPTQKDCHHPLNARLGKGCGLCGKDPV